MVFSLLLVIGFLVTGCKSDAPTTRNVDAEKKSGRVVVVSYALQYLTKRIAGDQFEIEFPAAHSDNPRQWKPGIADIVTIQKADLIVVNGPGADFADWLVRVTLPESKMCNTCQDLKLPDYITVKDYQVVHSHGPAGEHSHPYFVAYPWLDPNIAIKQANRVRQSLANTYPEKANLFQSNFELLQDDLEAIAAELPKNPPDENPTTVVTANPNLKYLTRAGGLNDVHLLWFDMPKDDPPNTSKSQFETRIHGIQSRVFLSSQPVADTMLAWMSDFGFECLTIELLDRLPSEGDFLDAMRANVAAVKHACNSVESK